MGVSEPIRVNSEENLNKWSYKEQYIKFGSITTKINGVYSDFILDTCLGRPIENLNGIKDTSRIKPLIFRKS